MTVIEIEDYYGNTLCAFIIKDTKKEDIINNLKDCSLADIESDYIFNTDEPLLRIQLNNKPNEN